MKYQTLNLDKIRKMSNFVKGVLKSEHTFRGDTEILLPISGKGLYSKRKEFALFEQILSF